MYGGDAHFQFYADRLEFDSYVLRSDTPGTSDQNLARRFQSGWRDDELTISAEYNEVQPNFNPEVGFVRRGDISQYAGEFTWAPRIERPPIQNLTFGTNVDYYNRESLDSIETRVQEATAGIRFRNNGSTNFTAARTFDRLFEPFDIRSNISIPPGDYEYTSYAANANIGNGRPDHRERQRRLGRVLGRAQQIGVRRRRLAAGLPFQLRRQLQPESRDAA